MRAKNPLYKTPRAITQEVLKAMFDYVGGKLIYKVRPACRVQVGDIAGTLGNHGYLVIRLAYRLYQVHNVIWMWHTGQWPRQGYELDHCNELKTDNRIENLREATRGQNSLNVGPRKNSSTGYKGVFLNPQGTYYVRAKVHGHLHQLGVFPTVELASESYQNFCKLNHGEFYRAPSIV